MTISYPDLTGQKGTKTASGYDLDGAAISGSGQITLRTFGEAVADGDLADGDQVYCTVYKDATNWATILATYNDLATDTLSSVTVLASDGTISNTDTVDIRVTATNATFDDLRLIVSETTAVTTADITGVAGYQYHLDISGITTASKNFTLPVPGAVGERIKVLLTAGDDAFELIIKGVATVTINGGSAATEWSRLLITGESASFVSTSTTNWNVEHDGRIPSRCKQDSNGQSTQLDLTDASWNTLTQLKNVVYDVGDLSDETNAQIILRRSGSYRCEANIFTNNSYTGDFRLLIVGTDNNVASQKFQYTTSVQIGASVNSIDTALAGDIIYLQLRPNTGASEVDIVANASQWISVYEVLDK